LGIGIGFGIGIGNNAINTEIDEILVSAEIGHYNLSYSKLFGFGISLWTK
jgi:hypothetical protein